MKILVTGGAGYIGSTVASALLDAGHTPIILDSLVMGDARFVQGRPFYQGDIADTVLLTRILREHPDIALTIHLAARIVVPESVQFPALYYQENVVKSLRLFEWLIAAGQTRVVFSSSASLYASPADFRVTEDSAIGPQSPYATTKWMMEKILHDLAQAHGLRGLALRYFNPIGADPKLRTGAYLSDPSHVLGRLLATAQGRSPQFQVTGTDYPTRDGTGLRDYIHVWDLAQAHVAAAEQFDAVLGDAPFMVINVGTGTGVTVRELLQSFEEASGLTLPQQDAPRRLGDNPGAFADITRARERMGWEPQLSTTDAIRSALAWEEKKRRE